MRCRTLQSAAAISRRDFLRISAAGVLLPCLSACGGSEETSIRFHDTVAWGREAIRSNMRGAPDAAAVSVALLWDDEIVWQEAFGQASVKDAAPATIHTRFNIGSVSKVLAGLAGIMLHETGRIHLDAPVVQYLPDFTMLGHEYREITCRHLLSHSSGLPGTNWRGIFAFEPFADYAADTVAGLAQFHGKHAPGQMAVYCNDGFTFFERVVHAVTGLAYAEYVQRHILEPLGMTESGYLVKRPVGGDFAYPVLGGNQYGLEFVNAHATGGLCTTPGDMMKLARMFIAGGVHGGRRLVSSAAIAEMAREQNRDAAVNPAPEWRWGLGWDSIRQLSMDAAGIPAWEKNGGTAFFETEFFVLPDAGMALLITGNRGYQPLQIAEEVLLRALQDVRVIANAPAKVDTAMPPPASPLQSMEEVAGIYASEQAPIRVEISAGGAIDLTQWLDGNWQPMDGGAQRFTLRSDGWWWADNGELPSYRFETIETSELGQRVRYCYLMARRSRGAGYCFVTMPVGQQLPPGEPLSAVWRARLGTRWRFANDAPHSVAEALGGSPWALEALPGLPGYILLDGRQLLVPLDEHRAGMAVKVPVSSGRDLDEIELTADEAGTIMRIGTRIYRPV